MTIFKAGDLVNYCPEFIVFKKVDMESDLWI